MVEPSETPKPKEVITSEDVVEKMTKQAEEKGKILNRFQFKNSNGDMEDKRCGFTLFEGEGRMRTQVDYWIGVGRRRGEGLTRFAQLASREQSTENIDAKHFHESFEKWLNQSSTDERYERDISRQLSDLNNLLNQ